MTLYTVTGASTHSPVLSNVTLPTNVDERHVPRDKLHDDTLASNGKVIHAAKIYAHRLAEEISRPSYLYDAEGLYGKAVQRGLKTIPLGNASAGHGAPAIDPATSNRFASMREFLAPQDDMLTHAPA